MSNVDYQSINTLRFLAVDAVEKARSGHPGMPMGTAPMSYVLWKDFMKFNPQNPHWQDRDRFVLSAGHGSALLYSLLHLFGYDVSIEDLKDFRQWGSKTPGHPEFNHTPGVETTTGPLGQGIANAVGMAIGETILGAHFNKEDIELVNHHTYVIAGDGDMMEGISTEVASLAGNLKLGKLIVLYDDNNITIEGKTDITFTEDVGKKYEALEWQVLRVEDGNDIGAISAAIIEAKEETERPTLIMIKTIIGFGSPNMADSSGVHGSPLGLEEIKLTRENLAWTHEVDFHVSQEVREHFESIIEDKKKEEENWKGRFEAYKTKYPELAKEWEDWHSDSLNKDIFEDEELWSFSKDKLATRSASGEVLNKLAQRIPNLIGGSADLAPSNNTHLKDLGSFSKENRRGRNIHYGVREHGMGAIMNGLLVHGGLRPFVGTFLIFSNYMRPAIRLSALMNIPGIYVFTHDSVAVGEDGPTHQPIEMVMSLRLIPNLRVFRPADGKETAFGYISALSHSGPTAMILTRQNLPILSESSKEALKGAYIIKKEKGERPDIIIIATGSEVHISVEAYDILQKEGIDARIISMPSWEIFEDQDQEYKNEILPQDIEKRLAVEAGRTIGWERYVGIKGGIIGIDKFGSSAPGDIVLKEYGISVENIVNSAKEIVSK